MEERLLEEGVCVVGLRDFLRREENGRALHEGGAELIGELVLRFGLERDALGFRWNLDRGPLLAVQRGLAPWRERASLLRDDAIGLARDVKRRAVRTTQEDERGDAEPDDERE